MLACQDDMTSHSISKWDKMKKSKLQCDEVKVELSASCVYPDQKHLFCTQEVSNSVKENYEYNI